MQRIRGFLGAIQHFIRGGAAARNSDNSKSRKHKKKQHEEAAEVEEAVNTPPIDVAVPEVTSSPQDSACQSSLPRISTASEKQLARLGKKGKSSSSKKKRDLTRVPDGTLEIHDSLKEKDGLLEIPFKDVDPLAKERIPDNCSVPPSDRRVNLPGIGKKKESIHGSSVEKTTNERPAIVVGNLQVKGGPGNEDRRLVFPDLKGMSSHINVLDCPVAKSETNRKGARAVVDLRVGSDGGASKRLILPDLKDISVLDDPVAGTVNTTRKPAIVVGDCQAKGLAGDEDKKLVLPDAKGISAHISVLAGPVTKNVETIGKTAMPVGDHQASGGSQTGDRKLVLPDLGGNSSHISGVVADNVENAQSLPSTESRKKKKKKKKKTRRSKSNKIKPADHLPGIQAATPDQLPAVPRDVTIFDASNPPKPGKPEEDYLATECTKTGGQEVQDLQSCKSNHEFPHIQRWLHRNNNLVAPPHFAAVQVLSSADGNGDLWLSNLEADKTFELLSPDCSIKPITGGRGRSLPPGPTKTQGFNAATDVRSPAKSRMSDDLLRIPPLNFTPGHRVQLVSEVQTLPSAMSLVGERARDTHLFSLESSKVKSASGDKVRLAEETNTNGALSEVQLQSLKQRSRTQCVTEDKLRLPETKSMKGASAGDQLFLRQRSQTQCVIEDMVPLPQTKNTKGGGAGDHLSFKERSQKQCAIEDKVRLPDNKNLRGARAGNQPSPKQRWQTQCLIGDMVGLPETKNVNGASSEGPLSLKQRPRTQCVIEDKLRLPETKTDTNGTSAGDQLSLKQRSHTQCVIEDTVRLSETKSMWGASALDLLSPKQRPQTQCVNKDIVRLPEAKPDTARGVSPRTQRMIMDLPCGVQFVPAPTIKTGSNKIQQDGSVSKKEQGTATIPGGNSVQCLPKIQSGLVMGKQKTRTRDVKAIHVDIYGVKEERKRGATDKLPLVQDNNERPLTAKRPPYPEDWGDIPTERPPGRGGHGFFLGVMRDPNKRDPIYSSSSSEDFTEDEDHELCSKAIKPAKERMTNRSESYYPRQAEASQVYLPRLHEIPGISGEEMWCQWNGVPNMGKVRVTHRAANVGLSTKNAMVKQGEYMGITDFEEVQDELDLA